MRQLNWQRSTHWFYFPLRSRSIEIIRNKVLVYDIRSLSPSVSLCLPLSLSLNRAHDIVLSTLTINTSFHATLYEPTHKFYLIFMELAFLLTKWLKGYVKYFFACSFLVDSIVCQNTTQPNIRYMRLERTFFCFGVKMKITLANLVAKRHAWTRSDLGTFNWFLYHVTFFCGRWNATIQNFSLLLVNCRVFI